MIEQLLPEGAVSSDVFGPDGSATLYPEEAALVARTTDLRREEFTTVRACARRALAALGLPPAPVLPGVRNVPQWPRGVVGSMTHCADYRAAVLARDTDLAMIGIDAEPDLPLPEGVLESIALPRELAWVRSGASGSGCAGTVCCSVRRKRSTRPGIRCWAPNWTSTTPTSPSVTRSARTVGRTARSRHEFCVRSPVPTGG